MSGSGGGGYSGGFEQFNSCDTLFIQTQLSSPKEHVVDNINIDDSLDVVVRSANSMSAVYVLHHGEVAGGVAAPNVQRLIECILQGTVYKATVISKNDGQVRIYIKPIQS
jgi:hypothetical protein